MNLLIIFTIGIQAIDSSYTFKAEKYCSGKSLKIFTDILPLDLEELNRKILKSILLCQLQRNHSFQGGNLESTTSMQNID